MPAAESLLADRYRLKRLVGAGASGQVWLAVDERLRREVAVKTVDLAHHHGDPGIVARFQREVRTSAALHSPHVAAIYDSGQDQHIAYMVMELLSGPSLAALLDADGPLDWDRGLALADDIAAGLADAHAEGIIHRDLKPGNVVLHDGLAKIVDFGIARATDPGDRTLTSPATITGTAAYMSPEQASGLDVTPATDVYSLGCVLFALFTGRPPFDAGSALATAGAHVHQAAPRLRDLRPDAPAPLDALVTQLLSKAPEERPDARTTARALARLRAELRKPGGAALAGELTAPMAAITAPLTPVKAPLATDALRRTPTPAPTPPPVLPVQPVADDAHRTAVMPAVEVAAAASGGKHDTPPARPSRRDSRAARRRPGSALRWLVTILLAVALAAVAWVGLGQPTPWAPSPTPTPTATTTTPSKTPAPTLTIPIVVPTLPTTTTAPPTTSAAPSPSATPTPTPTAPAASTPTALPSE